MSCTVMVCVAEELFPASSVAVNVRTMGKLLQHRQRSSRWTLRSSPRRSCRTPWRRPGHPPALDGVVGGTKVNSGAVVSCTVMVCVAEELFQRRRWPNVRTMV